MRLLLSTLIACLTCACVQQANLEPLALEPQLETPKPLRASTQLVGPNLCPAREPVRIEPLPVRTYVTELTPPQRARRKSSASQPLGFLQVQIAPPHTPNPDNRYDIRVTRVSDSVVVTGKRFAEHNFELELAPGDYEILVRDSHYPWRIITPPGAKTSPQPRHYFLHKESIRIHRSRNTVVPINTPQGGRFRFNALYAASKRHIEMLEKRQEIGTRKRSSRGCTFGPRSTVSPQLRDLRTGEVVPLVWALTDAMDLTGDLVLHRTYLMQNLLPAGEYEIKLTEVFSGGDMPPFSAEQFTGKAVRFQIEDGRTTGVVMPSTVPLDSVPRPPGR